MFPPGKSRTSKHHAWIARHGKLEINKRGKNWTKRVDFQYWEIFRKFRWIWITVVTLACFAEKHTIYLWFRSFLRWPSRTLVLRKWEVKDPVTLREENNTLMIHFKIPRFYALLQHGWANITSISHLMQCTLSKMLRKCYKNITLILIK